MPLRSWKFTLLDVNALRLIEEYSPIKTRTSLTRLRYDMTRSRFKTRSEEMTINITVFGLMGVGVIHMPLGFIIDYYARSLK
jgi:hypothetical protein